MGPADLVVRPGGVRFAGVTFPCSLGRGGIRADKREGDGATPAGVHRIVGMLWRADRMARPAGWAVPIGPRDLWCDDAGHPAYNRPVRAPFARSAERLRRADPLYDLVLLTDWNWPAARPGQGSAIFLHRWRRPGAPTEGCVAFDPADLAWIARRVVPGTRVIVEG
ncbi:L,D-transpeptidase family protein [uncultured Jannaschia sp.]|uniref:L,D-transpeptidase family protein n=1 Tax=uncultured Jannaschia sp. TaxID=293347 RepID=UPI00261453DA|nr:L,D-transpeptidase family protein [uncultured Jannaschia sp.]